MTTTNLFPRPAAPEGGDPLDRSPGPEGRWSLHRAGIVNVWQYDQVTFAFAGGRLLLRGKNGAGKSKALEVLLPLLLDADVRKLDATGRDRTTVTWLMTDGREGGNHVGYLWLELRLLLPDGSASFITLGAGLRASTAARRADTWFFITDRRPEVDIDLKVSGECLSIERLKEALGEEAVTTSCAEHRRRVGRQLFGLFDEARFGNLLHLLHRLRDPNIGNRVEAGELAAVLGDALPPVDDRVLAEAGAHFDDLDVIRDQVERSERTAVALGQFLGVYRGYARTVLSRRASAVEDAEASRARAARTARRLAREVEAAKGALGAAEATTGAARRERTERDAERRELERSEGYRAHQDLVDRQERVVALDAAATEAEGAAGRAGDAHERAQHDAATAGGELRQALGATGEAAASAAGLASEAGLDPSLLGPQPAPGPSGDVPDAALATAAGRAQAARSLALARKERAKEVRKIAVQSEQAAAGAAQAEERAAESEAEVDRERAAMKAAQATSDAAERAWCDAVTAWTRTSPASDLDTSWAPVLAELARRDRPGHAAGWIASVRASVEACLATPRGVARQAAAQAGVAAAAAAADLAAAQERLATVEAEPQARPEPSRFRHAERDGAAGAPLYELVDLAPGLDAADAAGLEAALEASGLLDAWVQADGLVVHPDTREILFRPDAAELAGGAATLTDVLVADPAEGSPVGAAAIASVLRAVGWGEQPGATAWVSASGRWSLGVLRGAWGKDRVEYLGAAARRATRERLLAELRAAVDGCESELGRATARADAASAHRDTVEALATTVPPSAGVDTAEADLRSAERALASARGRHDRDRRRSEEARAAANRLGAMVAAEAQRDGLPSSAAALDAVVAALTDLSAALAEHRVALDALRAQSRRLANYRAQEADRSAEAAACAGRARERRSEHATAAHELATLRRALASSIDAVLAQHRHATARLTALDEHEIPAADRAWSGAVAAHATATAQLSEAEAAERAAGQVVLSAGTALHAAVDQPGVLLAAAGEAADLAHPDPGDPVAAAVALAAAVLPLVAGGDVVTDSTILSRYDRLSEALAGGYDTAIDERDGVKVVHVADDTGRQPLAVVAARLAAEAEAAKGRLAAREREVFERFLLRELADEVRARLLDAHDLVNAANRTLASVHTSHGKGAHLEWRLAEDTAAHASVAARLLIDDLRDEAADAELREALLALIATERAADPTAGYEEHLRKALDFRSWHRFTVKVTDAAHPGASRTLSSRLGLSQGEQRVISYLALFSAAAAHFRSIARETPTAPRLLLLDDAFAKVDEPTHGELLGLLVQLEMDFVLTSERMWGCFPSVPSLEIYEAVRDASHPGVALVHFRWDGQRRHLVGV